MYSYMNFEFKYWNLNQVLKPCRGLVSFCFMYLVLCTKSENKERNKEKNTLYTVYQI